MRKVVSHGSAGNYRMYIYHPAHVELRLEDKNWNIYVHLLDGRIQKYKKTFKMKHDASIVAYHILEYLLDNIGKTHQGTYELPSAGMSKEQAKEILGFEYEPNEQEIKERHRKMIAIVHPDKGGSNFLAAQINLAKETLLN